jgi:hypothetical protein
MAVFSEYFYANREKDLLYFLLLQRPVISPSIHAIYILKKRKLVLTTIFTTKKALAVSSLYIAT